MQTFCQAHSEEIELVCNHPACSSPFLCLLCFQDHSNSCSANFKTDIKKVRHVAQDQQWIQTHEQKRKTIISPRIPHTIRLSPFTHKTSLRSKRILYERNQNIC